MIDPILSSFLEQQEIEAMALDRDSDIVDIHPIGPKPRQRYIVHFRCKGLVRTPAGIEETDRFDVGIYFPPDYWHRVQPAEVVTLLWPMGVWHSNIRNSWICTGRLHPGTSLVDIIMQVHAILTFQKITIREDDALQPEASSWARRNMHRFPLDSRPLRRRRVTLRVKDGPRNDIPDEGNQDGGPPESPAGGRQEQTREPREDDR